ncbi:MAG: hypothetical protein RJA99_4253 [Pseudomonadota bacterium]
MATIYTTDGDYLSQGLQGSDVCDHAIQTARMWAEQRNEAVVLEDDDGVWLVQPDGSTSDYSHAWAL